MKKDLILGPFSVHSCKSRFLNYYRNVTGVFNFQRFRKVIEQYVNYFTNPINLQFYDVQS